MTKEETENNKKLGMEIHRRMFFKASVWGILSYTNLSKISLSAHYRINVSK